MGTLMLKAFSNNEHLEISHAVLKVDDAFYEKVRARKKIFDAASEADADKELYTLSFWDRSVEFFSHAREEETVATDDDPVLFLPEDPQEHDDDEDNRAVIKAIQMKISKEGFSFHGYEKYSGDKVETEEVYFSDLPLREGK